MCEVRVLGTNPRHNASRALNRIKSKRPEKTKHNRVLLQYFFQSTPEIRVLGTNSKTLNI